MANCFGEDCWENAFCSIKNLFGIEALFLEQKEAIKAFIEEDTNMCSAFPETAASVTQASLRELYVIKKRRALCRSQSFSTGF